MTNEGGRDIAKLRHGAPKIFADLSEREVLVNSAGDMSERRIKEGV